MHTSHLCNAWSHLTDVVKTEIAAHNVEINERGEKWLEVFINAMHGRGKNSRLIKYQQLICKIAVLLWMSEVAQDVPAWNS